MTCQNARSAISAHFAGRAQREREEQMRTHLAGCEACRRVYERHLTLASLDPASLSRERRLGRALNLGQGRGGLKFPLVLGTLAAATAAVALVAWPSARRNGEFTARGGEVRPPTPEVQSYRVSPPAPPTPLKGVVSRTDELAFAYRNPGDSAYLAVFAVDEAGQVYWFHPAWTDPSETPRAVSVRKTSELQELPNAVRHSFRGEALWLYAIFLNQAMSVRELEAAIAAVPAGQPLNLKVRHQDVRPVRVLP